MFPLSNSVFAKQVSRGLVTCHKITGNNRLIGYSPNRINQLNVKMFFSQKSGAPTDDFDKRSHNKLPAKAGRNWTSNKFLNKSDTGKKRILFNSLKYNKNISFNKADCSKDSMLPTDVMLPKKISDIADNGNVYYAKKKYGVDLCRKSKDLTKPLITEKPYSMQYHITDYSTDHLNKANKYGPNNKDLPYDHVPINQDIPDIRSSNSGKKGLDYSGNLATGFTDNWTPSISYSPIVSKTKCDSKAEKQAIPFSNLPPIQSPAAGSYGGSEVPAMTPTKYISDSFNNNDKSSVIKNVASHDTPVKNVIDSEEYFEADWNYNWIPTAQYCNPTKAGATADPGAQILLDWTTPLHLNPALFQTSTNSASFQAPAIDSAYNQGNWIPTPQYFAADFTQYQGDCNGNHDSQPASEWMTHYRTDSAQLGGGSGTPQDPSDSSNDLCDKKIPFNSSRQTIYDVSSHIFISYTSALSVGRPSAS